MARPQKGTKQKGVELGEEVKNFILPSTGGEDFDLKNYKGKKIVLYFYPKDNTPGCTLEGHEFSQLKNQFKKLNTEVFGISRDSVKSHEKFKEKQCYAIELLSDETEIACQIFSVIKEKNMYGKKVMGVERSTFLIDEKGKLVEEWRGVKAQGHAQQVLDKVKSM